MVRLVKEKKVSMKVDSFTIHASISGNLCSIYGYFYGLELVKD